MRRISSKSEVIRCQRSSRTRILFLAWLMLCTRHSSLQCCLRPLPSLVAARFHPPQVSQRTVDPNQRSLNWRGLNRRSLPQAPQRPVNGSRSKSPRLLILTQTRPEKVPPPRDLKVKITRRLRKRGSKATTGSSKDGATPSKVRKELEADDAETTASTGPSEAALQTARFEQYGKDFPEVKEVRARILGLPEGEEATQEDFDSSPDFQLRWAVDETRPPTVIGNIGSTTSTAKVTWPSANPMPSNMQTNGLGPLLNTQGDSPLIAIIPPDMPFEYEREYVIHRLHKAECLARMSVYYDDNQ